MYNQFDPIYIYFLAFLPCVRLPPASVGGPTNLIFGMRMRLEYGLTLFGKSPRAEALRDSAMRGVRLHIYYIYFGQ